MTTTATPTTIATTLAKTITTNFSQQRDLAQLRQSELAELFAGLPTTTAKTLNGQTWRGRALAPLLLERAPRSLLGLACAVLSTPLNPWLGKHFYSHEGVNIWLGGAFKLGSYTVDERISPVDGQPTLWLDYDLPSNPAYLRAIRGEVRTFADGVFLARMNWRRADGFATVLYFTLRKD